MAGWSAQCALWDFSTAASQGSSPLKLLPELENTLDLVPFWLETSVLHVGLQYKAVLVLVENLIGPQANLLMGR